MQGPAGSPMHDWVLVSVSVDWEVGTARLELSWDGHLQAITARGLSNLLLPRRHPWGPSVHVNESHGPTQLESGDHLLSIEMQSGDKIELIAKEIEMPRG